MEVLVSTTVSKPAVTCRTESPLKTASAGHADRHAAWHPPEQVRRILPSVVASPAVWLSAVLALTLAGPGFPFDELPIVAVYLLFSLLTVASTEAAPDTRAAPAA